MTSHQLFSKYLILAEVSNTTGPGNASIVAFPGPAVWPKGSDHATHTPKPLKVYMRPSMACVPVAMAPDGVR